MATQTVEQFTDEIILQRPYGRTTFEVGEKVINWRGEEVRIVEPYRQHTVKDIDGDSTDAEGFYVSRRCGYVAQAPDGRQFFYTASCLSQLDGRRRHLQLVSPEPPVAVKKPTKRATRKAVTHG
ncbi:MULTISPECIES: hypothetical protein [unclassified Variovorax]|uniref:hypothetical protein n=1 Tax=unclassified Variovorax TaxID=663243 RepID=UPI0008389953|nr:MULTISPECIES: hypothetical protein [unclassified Variovorax]PNG56334.1 hypothetical protein CHC07_02749 [Variovorax sp. B4]PNG57758.1 hypothetical protein CHC06_02752 [Variovorax sp. B2]VTV09809.1 hypothetical protein WDL1CHR_00877 [Variovorax sp. WDL1]